MIKLNYISKRYWDVSEKKERINWCTSKMAILCHISVLWRSLAVSARGQDYGKECKKMLSDIILECFLLFRLLDCDDVEKAIKERIKEHDGKEY
jgi:hypothetical protein